MKDHKPPPAEKSAGHEPGTIVVEDEVLRAGFTQIPNLLLRREDISPGAKLTYMVLLSYAWQTDSCFPGHDRLAQDLGASRRSVVTYLQQLKDRGLIRVERRGLGHTNIYRLPKLSNFSPTPRSANSAHQEVQKTTSQEVQNLHSNKDSDDKDSDGKFSNIREMSVSKQNQDKEEPRQTRTSDKNTALTQPPNRHVLYNERSSSEGFTSVGALLPQLPPETASTRHPEALQGGARTGPHIEVPAQIRQIVEQVTEEFHDDPAKLLANLTRAMNLYKRSGLSEYGFCRVLAESQGVTKRAGSITKLSSQPGWQGLKNKVPYFFVVVENRLKELQMGDEDGKSRLGMEQPS